MLKSTIPKFLLFLSSFFWHHGLFSQVYSSNEGAKEWHFIYEVKEIDEFFERFNDDPESLIRTVYKSYHAKFNLTRRRLIKTLFNFEGRSWDSVMIKKFIAEVTNKQKPVYLDFYGGNWYAELACKFKYNGSRITIPITMQIETTQNNGSKWAIVAVGSSPLKSNILEPGMTQSLNKDKCISPTSHATNFVSLKRAFHDKENLSNYFDSLCSKRLNVLVFYNAVLNNQIDFLYVTKIKYHFLLANKWIFTVEYFPREELHSGWLINYMERVSPAEMQDYRNKLLNGNSRY